MNKFVEEINIFLILNQLRKYKVILRKKLLKKILQKDMKQISNILD